MPAVHFTVELPDGMQKVCYSPSTIVKAYFTVGEVLSFEGFVGKSRIALNEASERVFAKFGFSCSAASDQLQEIESWAANYGPEERVRIMQIQ